MAESGLAGQLARIATILLGLALLGCALNSLVAQENESRSGLATDGRRTFTSSCGVCHGIDGHGGEHAPNIATNPAVQRLTDARLRAIIRDGIPAGGMPSFRSLGPDRIGALVSYLRILQGRQGSREVHGDAVHGSKLFFGAPRCSSCHMIHGKGGFLGPDLSQYSLSHSAQEIREAILDPNKNLSPDDETVIVVTRDGRKLAGLARNEDNFSVQLQTPDGEFHLLLKSGLASLRREPRSLMPSDYASKLSRTELDDLVAFIASEQQRVAPQSEIEPFALRAACHHALRHS